ncbi:MAG TPA: phosphoribosylaminoimidazolesuccinocarboxamide synthase [Deltaproteobacteria bacterium]|nr:phosphoribosylaminoimidazolesuccinocarboxamide synthase [Deltaproteobacteria bacterium]
MELNELLYTGKSKQIFATEDPARVLVRFTDEATAFNARKRAKVADKGRINCAISARLFEEVGRAGVRHHLVRQLSPTDLLCERVEIVPVEVVVRSVVAGSFARRYGLTEGTRLPRPVVEWFYKSDALDDPLIGDDALLALGFAEPWELAFMTQAALTTHRALEQLWDRLGVDLIDAKYEFGRQEGRLLLADELTPDGSRLWEQGSGRPLDKDVFRKDLADLSETYRQLHARLLGGPQAAGGA